MYGQTTLLKNAAVTGAGASVSMAEKDNLADNTFQAIGTTTAGAGAASIDIEVSNNGVNWLVLGTITLTLGVTAVSDGFAANAAWLYTRADLKTVSGTGAAVTVLMGS